MSSGYPKTQLDGSWLPAERCVPLPEKKPIVYIDSCSKPDCSSNDSPEHLLQVKEVGDAATHGHAAHLAPHAHTRHIHTGDQDPLRQTLWPALMTD